MSILSYGTEVKKIGAQGRENQGKHHDDNELQHPKPTICICKNKGEDLLCSHCAADLLHRL